MTCELCSRPLIVAGCPRCVSCCDGLEPDVAAWMADEPCCYGFVTSRGQVHEPRCPGDRPVGLARLDEPEPPLCTCGQVPCRRWRALLGSCPGPAVVGPMEQSRSVDD